MERSSSHVRDGADAQKRLHELRCKLLKRGINAEPIGICRTPGCAEARVSGGGGGGGGDDGGGSETFGEFVLC